jgi:thiol-disulfide isomerase/thioredoxin
MRRLAAILICWASMSVALFAGAESLVRVETPGGFCSGVCVGPQLVLTANHCQPTGSTVVVTRSGDRVAVARVVKRIKHGDHTVALELAEAIDAEPAKLAAHLPQAGERLESFGFAHAGPLRRYRGTAISSRWRNQIGGAGLLRSSVMSEQGVSGGGVFDADDELVAIVSGMDYSSTFSMTDVRQCLQAVAAKKTTLVAFVSPGCPPCMAFRRDLAAGAFAKLDVKIVSYDGQTGTWSDPALYREAIPALRASKKQLAFPCFWIRGRADAASIRIGYRESRGLLQFVASVIDTIIGGIIGRPPQAQFPTDQLAVADEQAPPPVPAADNSPPTPDQITDEFQRVPSVDEIKTQVRDLRELVGVIADDVSEFQDAGVIGKLRRLDDLRDDKKQAVEQVAELRKTVNSLRANPTGFLVSLVGGLFAGLMKRRFKP